MGEESKKKKFRWQAALIILIPFAAGAALGIAASVYVNTAFEIDSPAMNILFWIGLLLGLYAAAFVQTIIHETGHLLFGLLTG